MERWPALVLADAIDAGLRDAKTIQSNLRRSHLRVRMGEAIEALHVAHSALHELVRAWDRLDGVAPRQER